MKSGIGGNRAEVEGYAAVYDVPDMTGDVIRKGAFHRNIQKLIRTDDSRVIMLYQHSAEKPVGKWNGFREDDFGLFVRGELFLDTENGLELHRLLYGGAIDGLSIGFKPQRVRRNREGRRELLSVELWEVSIVTFPMAPRARVTRVGEPGSKLPKNLLN